MRQVDQARSDFAAIEDDLDFIKRPLARLPTGGNLLHIALFIIPWTAGIVLIGIELMR